MKKLLSSLSFTIFVFGFAGWVYNAVYHPQTLALPLTHLLPFPREDVFGIVCFGLAFVGLFVFMFLREEGRR